MRLHCLVCPPFRGVGFKFFPLAWVLAVAWAGAGCCSALHVPPGRVSPALVLLLPVVDACGLVLVQVMPCRAACWCSGLGSRVRLSLLAVYCIGGGRCPACGLLAAVWWGLLWLCSCCWRCLRCGRRWGCWLRLRGGVAPAPCLAPSGQSKKRLQPCGLCLCDA